MSLFKQGVWMIALLSSLLQGCALPPLEGRSESRTLSPAEATATRLGRTLSAQVQAHPGESGILPLADALESFAARVLLVRAAERTLDVQYYIWRDDITGNLLLNALRQAAERGVRVRLLLDDNGVAMDAKLLALDRHPGIEVRLFNPFSIRQPKALGYLTHFSRANRRMHNKALIADSQAAIMGGRNVGDEYFGATEGVLFADLDVLAAGAVLPDLAVDFDRYWASASAYPIDSIVSSEAAAQDDVEVFSRLAASGVRVRILTNALEATDVSAVHSGYARYRKALLRAGVELYEMRRGAVPPGRAGVFGSSGSSLHAKTFAIDGQRVFVGSMNFDPRSAHLNTELGFIIDSPALAAAVGASFQREIPAAAYAVRLDEQGGLVWIEQREGGAVRHTREPGSTLARSAWIGLLSVLPIEWLL